MKTSLAAILCILFSFNVFACATKGEACGMGPLTEKCCSGLHCTSALKCEPN